jgi:hypothetical protein
MPWEHRSWCKGANITSTFLDDGINKRIMLKMSKLYKNPSSLPFCYTEKSCTN